MSTIEARTERVTACPLCGHSELDALFTKEGYHLDRCQSCALVFVANPPTAEELSHFYSFASGYHRTLRDDPREIANRVRLAERQYAAIRRHRPEPGRLLDVGASAGFFVKTAADHGWQAQGVELSEDTARVARERQRVDVRAARLEDVDFPPDHFDVVTLWDVIEHVPDPVDTMRRVAALVKPRGVVGLLTPNIDGLYPRVSYKLARRLDHWPAVEPPAHLFQFSTRTLEMLLERTGFSVLEVEHERQPLSYTFGRLRSMRHPKRLAYSAVFAPFAALGPRVGAGDEILVIARRDGPVQHPAGRA